MISGVHAIVFSPAADEVRAFFRDRLGLPNVDAGDGCSASPCRPPNWPPGRARGSSGSSEGHRLEGPDTYVLRTGAGLPPRPSTMG